MNRRIHGPARRRATQWSCPATVRSGSGISSRCRLCFRLLSLRLSHLHFMSVRSGRFQVLAAVLEISFERPPERLPEVHVPVRLGIEPSPVSDHRARALQAEPTDRRAGVPSTSLTVPRVLVIQQSFGGHGPDHPEVEGEVERQQIHSKRASAWREEGRRYHPSPGHATPPLYVSHSSPSQPTSA